jgi:hypothetical protein
MYYLKAFEAMLGQEEYGVVLWPLLNTWTQAISLLSPEAPQQESWSVVLKKLGLGGKEFGDRVSALDAYLDLVEETLEDWAKGTGA